VNIHRYHSIVASSEVTASKDRSLVLIHIWDYIKLETIIELRKEQFGSDITLLSFSLKPDDNFILIVSRDKPKTLLFVDWKLNELVYSITVCIIFR
jgi:WD40 repeat protein